MSSFQPMGHVPFRFTTAQAKQLLKSADGIQQNQNPDWKGFPQRTQDEWGVGFTRNYDLLHAARGEQDGALSFEEKSLASRQLAWDRQEEARKNTTNTNPIDISKEGDAAGDLNPLKDSKVVDQARNAQNFLSQIFSPEGQIREGLDTDKDGRFTEKDIDALAGLDGDADLTSADFDVALGIAPKAEGQASDQQEADLQAATVEEQKPNVWQQLLGIGLQLLKLA